MYSISKLFGIMTLTLFFSMGCKKKGEKVFFSESHGYIIQLITGERDSLKVHLYGSFDSLGVTEFFRAEGYDLQLSDTFLGFGLRDYVFSMRSFSNSDFSDTSNISQIGFNNWPSSMRGPIEKGGAVFRARVAPRVAFSNFKEVHFVLIGGHLTQIQKTIPQSKCNLND